MIGGLTYIDWAVIAVYLLGITAIGTWAIRRVKSSTSFFISDRGFGKLMMMFFAFGTGTHSDQAVSVSAETYRSGASGIWYQWLWLFCTPFYWLIAPMFRRMRAVTMGDYFEARFDRSVAVLFAVFGIINLTVNIGVMLKGSSAMITAVSGGAIPADFAILAMTVMFVIYGVAGGLSAAIITDFVQGILTIVLSFLILPFALYEVGGMTGMREVIRDPHMFSLVAPGKITAFYIAVISLNGLIGFPTQAHNYSICAAGKSEMESRVGLTCGNFVKRFCTVAWMLTGLCAVAIYIDQEVDIDHVYGLMANKLLPKIGPGLVGLFIASMLAAVMSSCDAFMVAASALFTENVYRKHIVPRADDRHYMFVGRTVSILVVVAGIVFAFSLENVVTGLEIFWKVSAMMGVAFWVGLFWRRTTSAGAWAGTLVSFAVFLFTSKISILERNLWDFNNRFVGVLPEFMFYTDPSKNNPQPELLLSWQMILYLTAGLMTLLAVSLMTKPIPKTKLDRLYLCLRTPVEPGEPETEPFSLPPGVEPAPRNVMFDFLDLEVPKFSMVGLVGLLVAMAVVGLLIGGVYWIFS
jgi:SSS family transporter